MIYDERFIDDSVSVGIGRIWGAKFCQGGKEYYAIPFRQGGKGLPRQVRSGRALGQDDHTLHALLGQHPGADKSIAPVVALPAQKHRPLPPGRAATAQHFLARARPAFSIS